MKEMKKYMTKSIPVITLVAMTLLLNACGGDDKKNEPSADTTPNVENRKTGELKIAYYDQDSLFLHFKYYVERDSVMTAKGLAFQNELQRRSSSLDAYIQKKDQEARSGILSENEIMQVQQTIQQKQADIMRYQEEQGRKIEEETVRELEDIGSKIAQFGKQYSEENGLDILMVKAGGGQFNYIHPSMDVTKEFTEYLNQKQAEIEADLDK